VTHEAVRFESLKEHRGWYFVEYSPPTAGLRFSSVGLTCLESRDASVVARAMESEARYWINRYPIPVMVSAFEADGGVFNLNDARPCNYLFAWDEYPYTELILTWRVVTDEELPDVALDVDFVQTLFAGVPYKSRDEIKEDVARHLEKVRMGRRLVFIWAVVIPAGVAILEWWSDLLGLVIVICALCKAGAMALRLSGRIPKSEAQRKKEEDDLQMRHHHYHCVRNPEGFARLKAENFQKWEVERTFAESERLKQRNRHNDVED
jgi:hypothetical protein